MEHKSDADRGVYVGGNLNVSGDFVGRDKIVIVSGDEVTKLFADVYRRIKARPVDPDVDREELTDTVQKIEQEVALGEQADADKVERWLRTLAPMAPDIFEVIVACLTSPAAGIAAVVRKVAEKASRTPTGADTR